MLGTLSISWRRGALVGIVLAALGGCETVPQDTAPAAVVAGPIETSGDLALGQRALEAGDIKIAKQAFSAVIRRRPDDPAAMLGLAEAYLAEGDLDTANRMFDVLQKIDAAPEARVLQGLGTIALRRGQAREAQSYLDRSVAQDGTLWRAWLALGQAHDLLDQPDAARRAFKAAESYAPVRAGVQNDLGMSHLGQNEAARAAQYFERALALDPGHTTARANLRIAKAMMRDYDGALSGAEPHEMADVLNNVGYIAIINKDFGLADQLLRRAIEVSPVYHAAAAANLNLLDHAAGVGNPGTPGQPDPSPAPAVAAVIPPADRAPATNVVEAVEQIAAAEEPDIRRLAPASDSVPHAAVPPRAEANATQRPGADLDTVGNQQFMGEQGVARVDPQASLQVPVRAATQAEDAIETADIPAVASRSAATDRGIDEAMATTPGRSDSGDFQRRERTIVEVPVSGPIGLPRRTEREATATPRDFRWERPPGPGTARFRDSDRRADRQSRQPDTSRAFNWEAPPAAGVSNPREAEPVQSRRGVTSRQDQQFRWEPRTMRVPDEAAGGDRMAISTAPLAAPDEFRWTE